MPERMPPGTRVRLTESCPWPERCGLLGRVATVPENQHNIYPNVGLRSNEVIVLLDEDPIGTNFQPRWWTCVLDIASVEAVPDA